MPNIGEFTCNKCFTTSGGQFSYLHAFLLSPLVNYFHACSPCSARHTVLFYLIVLLNRRNFCLLCRHQLYFHACSSCSPSKTDFGSEQIHSLSVVQRCQRVDTWDTHAWHHQPQVPRLEMRQRLVLAAVVKLFMYRMEMSQYARWGNLL